MCILIVYLILCNCTLKIVNLIGVLFDLFTSNRCKLANSSRPLQSKNLRQILLEKTSTNPKTYCLCGKCELMPTVEESSCCKNSKKFNQKMPQGTSFVIMFDCFTMNNIYRWMCLYAQGFLQNHQSDCS